MYTMAVVFMILVVCLHVFCAGAFFYFFPSKITKILFWAMPIFGTLLIMAGFALHRRAEGAFGGPLLNIAYYWLGILFIAFSICLVLVCGVIVLGWLKIAAPAWLGKAGLAVIIVFVILAVIGGLRAPAIEKINLKAANLPVGKLTIVQIADTHLGVGINVSRVKKMVDSVNALQPDLILVTGDFFEGGKNRQQNIDALKQMKAKYGIYGTLGNHEFYGGVQANAQFFDEAGVKLLRSQTVSPVPGLAISGMDDFAAGRISKKKFAEFLNTLNPKDYNILMQHEPLYFDAARGKVNLMLCGHTHNGQIFPFNLAVRTRYKKAYGLYSDGGTDYYVTSGAFYWGPPMRLFTQNEVPFITITRE